MKKKKTYAAINPFFVILRIYNKAVLPQNNCLQNPQIHLPTPYGLSKRFADKNSPFADFVFQDKPNAEILQANEFFMKKMIACFSILFPLSSSAQKVDWEKLRSIQPDKILLSGERKPTKVLLLGTFHFGYPNLDGHKTDSSKFVDVKSPQRQKELEELAGVIKRFKPTRIYVESSDQGWIDSLYGEYVKGHYKMGRNEIYQVGFRVAGQMKHPKLYAVDTWPFSHEFQKQYKWIDSLWEDKTAVDSLRDKYWDKKYSAMYTASDSIHTVLTMLENFLLMAEPSTIQRMHGHYLCGGFNTESTAGPDAMSVWWYNRNLRIFNNVLKTKPTAADRIVVLFGNGHMPLLRHCFYSSPEFEIVELKNLLQ